MSDQDIDALFASLRSAAPPTATPAPDAPTDDVLSVADADADARHAAFRDIEQRLRRLPRIQSGFDGLAAQPPARARSAPPAPAPPAADWFQLPRPELTPELRRDLALIKHRAALDPKRHYRKEKWQVPERFSVGTVIEGTGEFYSSRLQNSQRKATMLETLLADDDSARYFRRRYAEVQVTKTSGKRAHYKRVRDRRRRP
ncbi:AFR514Cp [Eremothecium gossypii ATCC 10895]|uniref:AFR514Cp n=1 Tax=Eremothecium gossypii (strain ATCC 10895 / CBS 109.51 / FGSC 9923 / NRRL Y-1056) TaxID=284811 RepID=Q752Q9_EREGS|nr:AFR514Cp [Eremothecium gossypii ATCC 10895]AAS53885.1 AFR514Cp [Eremothecium gossypii ATCC 10895]AEY98198.1 FAFR514Cp [Eremothecium gossypii FDAG1]